ncbi:MAG TPA: hypothetical protein VL287_18825 [Gemmatimonadales bacterium]|jgi:hypothetical protein|nr:hypothetical protein [Gemmatimonadales bacterium]
MRTLLVAILLLAPSLAGAQSTDSSRFVILHGADTVATEDLNRTDTELHGTLAFRGAKTTELYRAVVAPDETVPLVEVTVREAPASSAEKARIAQQARIIFRNDSVSIDDISNHGLETRVLATQTGAVPYINLSFGLLEQAIRRAAVLGKDSVKVAFFNLTGSASQGGGATVVGTVSRHGADSVSLDLGQVEFRMRVDARGRLVSGGIPAQQVSFTRN